MYVCMCVYVMYVIYVRNVCIYIYMCVCVYVCVHIFSSSNFHLHMQVEALWSRLRYVKDLNEK
jgi:hypothetical protein